MKAILIVEDEPGLQKLYATHVDIFGATEFEPVLASSISEAREKFIARRADIAGIILDGQLRGEGSELASYTLAKFFVSEGFKGPIVANSSDERVCDTLVTFGCNVQSEMTGEEAKLEAVSVLLGALETTTAASR